MNETLRDLIPAPPRCAPLKQPRLIAGLVILAILAGAALFAPWLARYDPLAQDLLDRRQPPSFQHPMGLDELGRDNLSRVIYGARLSLYVGIVSVAVAATVGGLLGVVAGYRGGWIDSFISSAADVMMAFPTLLLAIAIVSTLGPGLNSALLAVAFTAIPTYARLIRVGVLREKRKDHLLAARAVGVPTYRLIRHHILPGCLAPLQAQAALGAGTAILEVVGLSFLGLGAQPPAPEWGAMLSQGRGAIFAAPHIVLFPGLALMLTVLSFNLVGSGLRDWLDPTFRA